MLIAIGLAIAACRDSGSRTIVSAPTAEGITLVVSERGASPSGMPWQYGELLNPESPRSILAKTDVCPRGFIAWSHYGGTLEPDRLVLENMILFFATDPDHVRPMMRGLEQLDLDLVKKLKDNQRGCLIGPELLARVRKHVGDQFWIHGISHKGIDLEFEVVGELPESRYKNAAIMNVSSLKTALEEYERANGEKHEQRDRVLAMIHLRAVDAEAVKRITKVIEDSPDLAAPRLSCRREEDVLADLLKEKSP